MYPCPHPDGFRREFLLSGLCDSEHLLSVIGTDGHRFSGRSIDNPGAMFVREQEQQFLQLFFPELGSGRPGPAPPS